MTSVADAINRKNTAWFIEDDPEEIVLLPRVKEPRPGGGHRMVPGSPREPQTFKLANQSGSNTGKIQAADGSDRQYDFVLIGRYDAIVEIGDNWTKDGVMYVVEGFAPKNNYEVKAGVKAYGEKPSGG